MREVLVAFIVFGLIAFFAAIWGASQDNKAVVSCLPVHYVVSAAGSVASLAVSSDGTPKTFPWQDNARLWCLRLADRWFRITNADTP
jgi:hypothetical protein